jgi:hypothetical protein
VSTHGMGGKLSRRRVLLREWPALSFRVSPSSEKLERHETNSFRATEAV